MGKLSLNRKKGAENQDQRGGQRKITGFFPPPVASGATGSATHNVVAASGATTAADTGSSSAAVALSKILSRTETKNVAEAGSLLSPSSR
jgi:hypothetical protein